MIIESHFNLISAELAYIKNTFNTTALTHKNLIKQQKLKKIIHVSTTDSCAHIPGLNVY